MIKTFKMPKYYEVSINLETGEVKVFSSSKHAKGRELKQWQNADGYLTIKLNNKTFSIHCLVSNFILGERPKDYVVNHKDGVKTNNRPSNLEYVTLAENTRHSVKYGMHICNRPELMPTYKDGRCKDKVKYKHDWYIQNKQRILEKMKKRYYDKKQVAKI